jgi:hypothetical protein
MLLKQIPSDFDTLCRLINTGYACLHFGQCGEDAILWHYFADRSNGFYVDVGCHHPYRYSNTALLATYKGWHGINIDLDERAIDAFRLIRPGDTNLNIAIGHEVGEVIATIFEDGAVNSLDSSLTAHQSTIRDVRGTKTVQVRPLSAILDDFLPSGTAIDFMNVDAEGWDHMVLESNDWMKYRPEFIAVECHGFDLSNPQGHATFRFLTQQGYRLTSHAVITSIYQRIA